MSNNWIVAHGAGYKVPSEIASLVEDGLLMDGSYKNDTCPRFFVVTSYDDINENHISLWVEHPESELRDSDTPRYCVQEFIEGEPSILCETDSLEEAVRALGLLEIKFSYR